MFNLILFVYFFQSGNWYFKCPVDNTWSNHVFEDNAVKREILSLKVDCVNSNLLLKNNDNDKNKSCNWCGELRELQVC